MTAAKMDVASNDDSLTEIGKYFAILIFVIHTDREIPRKLQDRENFSVYGTSIRLNVMYEKFINP